MDRVRVRLTPSRAVASGTVSVSPELVGSLAVTQSAPHRLRLGVRETRAWFRAGSELPPDEVQLAPDIAASLGLVQSLSLTTWSDHAGLVTFGPLVGLLISEAKLAAVCAGKRDIVYCRYSHYAEEIGAELIFFSESGLASSGGVAHGFRHKCHGVGGCRWEPVDCPVPTVIYDRCFGMQGREEAVRVRERACALGFAVVNHLPKITKLQTFAVLRQEPAVTSYLPLTERLTAEALGAAMARLKDLYLKPDALYKGKGIYRLVSGPDGWSLQSRQEQGNVAEALPAAPDLPQLVDRIAGRDTVYLIQEGLDLATYMGNRFDFRSLVQRDGRGRWTVSGLVARIAPVGSTITSPRSGGQIASPGYVLRHAFPDRWRDVLSDLVSASLRIAEGVDRHLGPCLELGLDMGVLADGPVRLIEVNGKPLRVSLDRLKDPLVSQRVNRYPIHCAAYWAMKGAGACRQ